MKLIVTMHVHQHCPQLCLFKKIIKLCLLFFFVQKKEKKNMEDFNRLSSKIVCYNYTFWQMNTFCVRKCTHSMVSVLILALNCKKKTKKQKKSEILLRDNVMIHQFQISLKVSTTSYFVYKKMFSIHWFYMYDNCARPEQYYPPPFRISRSHCYYLKIFFFGNQLQHPKTAYGHFKFEEFVACM